MKIEEKLELLSTILNLSKDKIDENTILEEISCWDSLTMVNMQIELMMYTDNIELSEIKNSKTISDLCGLI